ncbi:MAG: hypothetical protein HQL69_14335 [Magnetococcales bacterium]|nr:hypothetical protein [Magnetococcales bacterium]
MTEPQNDSLSSSTAGLGGVSHDNFSDVWKYILAEIESGRWDFADWPLENLQEIPLIPDAQGKAVEDLNLWINRHLKAETQKKMFKKIDPEMETKTTKKSEPSKKDDILPNQQQDTQPPEPGSEPSPATKEPAPEVVAKQPPEDVASQEEPTLAEEPAQEVVARQPSEVAKTQEEPIPAEEPAQEVVARQPSEVAKTQEEPIPAEEPAQEVVARQPSEVVATKEEPIMVEELAQEVVARQPSEIVPSKAAPDPKKDDAKAASPQDEAAQAEPASPTKNKAELETISPPAAEEPEFPPISKRKVYEPEKPPTILNEDFEAKKAEFEAKKAASEIILSEKTRNRLLQYREGMFGAGQGSMELAIRQLLDGVERTLPIETFQKLSNFQNQNSLATPDEALNKLLELTQPTGKKGELSLADSTLLKEELEKLLADLKA